MESRHLAVMMTDIQGFTRATSGMGREEVDALLARHEELLLPVFEAHEGTVVKGLGDAFLVTFESPAQAVRAGVRIQEVLADHNAAAPEDEVLRVRVALNSGEVNLRGGDVFGEAVNITARVEGVCAAEQVTLTEAVYLQVDAAAFDTEYLEAVELKGIPFPVKLYRVTPTWLPEDRRDIARARSAPPPASSEGGPGIPWKGVAAAGLVVALVAGAGVALRPSPLDRAREAVASGDPEVAWEVLEETRRRSPSPELLDLARAFLAGRREALADRPLEEYRLVERFAGVWPGVQGLSDPATLRELGLDTLRRLREAGRYEHADALLEELSAQKGWRSDAALLATWAREDLRRVYEAAVVEAREARAGPDDGGPLAAALADDALVRPMQRVRELAPDAPLLAFLEGVRATLGNASLAGGNYGSPVAPKMRGLGRALSEDPALAARAEARPAYKAFLSIFPWDEDEWEWGDQILALRVGAWIVPDLERWVNEAPPPDATTEDRVQNLYLRKNARRILDKRGAPARVDRDLWIRAAVPLIQARPSTFSQSELLELVQEVDLLYQELGARPDPATRSAFRGLLAWGLEGDDEGITWRSTLSGMARAHGFEELDQPDRELQRDLRYLLIRRRSGWNFQVNDWDERMLRDRLPKALEAAEPYRGAIRGMLLDAVEAFEEQRPELGKLMRETAEKLGS